MMKLNSTYLLFLLSILIASCSNSDRDYLLITNKKLQDLTLVQYDFDCKSKGLKVYGIEFTKQDSTGLTDYIENIKIEYPTLYSAKDVASKYDVSAGPSVFLIKDGKFVYARTGFNKDEVIKEIAKNLN